MKKYILILCLISSSAFSQEEIDTSKSVYEAPVTERMKQIDKEIQQRSPEENERSRSRFIEAIKSNDRDIVFRGKVIDYDGNPVQDAVAVLSVRSFDPTDEFFMSSKEYKLNTNSKGLFEFRGKGRSLGIRDIIKDGYEFRPEYLKYSYFMYPEKIMNGNSGENVPFDPDSDVPFVFSIRKRGTVDYLFTSSFSLNSQRTLKAPFFPLLLGEWFGPYGEAKNPNPPRSERKKSLKVSCSLDEDQSNFELAFEGVEGSGVYLSHVLLYEAPAEGYQPQLTYRDTMIKSGENEQKVGWYEKKLYLYVKGPDESYYSRVDLSINTVPATQNNKDAGIQVSGDIYTNPEGRRYLDYNKELNENEDTFRMLVKEKRDKATREANKNNKPFDEKAFKKEVDEKYKNRDWRQIFEELRNEKDKN